VQRYLYVVNLPTVGLSFALLCIMLCATTLVHRRIAFVRSLYIFLALLGVVLVLILGPHAFEHSESRHGLLTSSAIELFEALPALLINALCAAFLLGSPLPRRSQLAPASRPGLVDAATPRLGRFMAGHMAIGGLTDVALAAALGLVSLSVIAHEIGVLLSLALVAAAWSIAAILNVFPIAERAGRLDRHYEPLDIDPEVSVGSHRSATLVIEIASMRSRTEVRQDLGHQQLGNRSLLDGRLITSLAVPFIVSLGMPVVGEVGALLALCVAMWGIRR
jgi:hypothetical protein